MTQLGAELGPSSAGPLFEPAREARRQESPPAIHLGPGTNLSLRGPAGPSLTVPRYARGGLLKKLSGQRGGVAAPAVCRGPEGPGRQGPRFVGPVLLLYD
jgi:hypothetical protein